MLCLLSSNVGVDVIAISVTYYLIIVGLFLDYFRNSATLFLE